MNPGMENELILYIRINESAVVDFITPANPGIKVQLILVPKPVCAMFIDLCVETPAAQNHKNNDNTRFHSILLG
jgi:hypothetical protein